MLRTPNCRATERHTSSTRSGAGGISCSRNFRIKSESSARRACRAVAEGVAAGGGEVRLAAGFPGRCWIAFERHLQPGDADLVTLHVYSPPLLWMGTYSLTDTTRGQEPMFLEFSEAAGI